MHRNTEIGWSSRLGSVDLKTIIALVFALGGLSWAVIAMMGGKGDSSKNDEPRVIASALDDEGNAVEADYTSTKGEKRLGNAAVEIQNVINTDVVSVLSSIEGPKGSAEGVSEAVINAFIPLVSGDHDAFLLAIAAMGGQISGDLDGEHPIFTHLKKEFEGAKIDLDRIRVTKHEPQERQMMGMRQQRELTDEEREQATSGFQTQTQRMQIRSESLFPDAPEDSDPSAIEVQIPVQPKGEDLESVFSLVLTWNADLKLWQPATYGIIKNRMVETDG